MYRYRRARSVACFSDNSRSAWVSADDRCTDAIVSSASVDSPESAAAASNPSSAVRSKRSSSRLTFRSKKVSAAGSRPWGAGTRSGAAAPDNRVAERTRKSRSVCSACVSLSCALRTCSPRIFTSSESFSRRSSAATTTKRSAMALTMAVMASGFEPRSSTLMKFPTFPSNMSVCTRSWSASACAAAAGVVMVKSIVRPGVSAPLGGSQANPSAGPMESPTAPCCTSAAPRALLVSRNRPPPDATATRYVPGSTRSLMANDASAALSPGVSRPR